MKTSFFDFKLFQVPSAQSAALSEAAGKAQLIVLAHLPDPYQEELRSFLKKVLAAIELDLDQDTLFITIALGEKFPLSQLIKEKTGGAMLIFGLPPADLGIHFQLAPYQIINHQGQAYLLADELMSIYEERQAGGKQKSALLWKGLKQISSYLNKKD